MDVIQLLKSKNRCLLRLMKLCGDFLEQDDLDQLESFQREREVIFKALDLYDRKITEAVTTIALHERTPALAALVQTELDRKDRMIHTIITRDNELMLRIENRKGRLMEELSSSRRNHDLVGKFKSTWVSESGEEIDKKL